MLDTAIRLSLLALLVAACGRRVPGAMAYPVETSAFPAQRRFLDEIDRSMGRRDCFTVVRDGRFVPALEAPRMLPGERVLGLDLGDVQVAYPIQYLNLVEIVEHRAGGHDLLVCWCPLCGTGVVHDRSVDGRVLTFGHSGWLWHNAFLLYDRETDSLWHHATGVAMSGALRGTRLKRFDGTALMTFAAWCAEHPHTLLLAKPSDPADTRLDADVYAERNAHVRFGVALELPGAPRFYPFDSLAGLDAVEDEVAGTPVLVVRDAEAAVARAFDRRVGGRTLSFDIIPGRRPELQERGGPRRWFLRSGAPVPGTGADDPAPHDPLCPLPATSFERNAWDLQHPAGSVWHRP